MHIFHKWKQYPKTYESTFMGEKIQNEYKGYRKCTVCGKVQEHAMIGYEGWSYWETLNPSQTKVFNMKEKQERLILQTNYRD